MARLIFIVFMMLSLDGFAFSKVKLQPQEMSSRALFGPEVFEFCGGWVEVWIRRVIWENEFILRVSPPDGAVWEVTNGHIIVEKSGATDEAYKFKSFQTMKVQRGDYNTHIWRFDGGSAVNEFKVALLPFNGCQIQQKTRGVVLREDRD